MDNNAFPAPADEMTPPPGGLPFGTAGASEPVVAAADHAARHWAGDDAGPVKLGSDAHKRLACRMFRETFNPYKPSVIDWPKLTPEARDRLVNLPIWDIAVHTEGKARLHMLTYAHSLSDTDWRDAIELNGWEEGRHKAVLSNLVQAYGIALVPEPEYVESRSPAFAYIRTGFSECIDSFFAFGLFALAKRSGFFPPELVDTFEPVIQEECRHILLFANWVAWTRRSMPVWRRPWFELRVAAAWMVLAWERVDLARGMDGKGTVAQDNNFTMVGSKAVSDVDIGVADLLRLCLAENDRRFAGYDPRLRRPTTMPTLARVALLFMRRGRAA
jgi:hypothetical protein